MVHPGGRPSIINDVINHREVNGETVPVTRIEQIAQDLSIGIAAHRAARRAGITPETFYEWERTAAKARQKQIADEPLTEYEASCVDLSDRVVAAELAWEARQNVALEAISRGGQPVVVTTVKVDADGNELETTTRTTATLPDARVILNRLKLRFPDEYGERITVEGKGEDGAIPIEIRAQKIGEALAEFQRMERERGELPNPE